MATIREVSEKIRDHLTQQKARAVSDASGGSCRYLDPQGNKCAVGCLIPEGGYDVTFEGSTIQGEFANAQRLRDLLSEHYGLDFTKGNALKVLTDWQRYHDAQGYDAWIQYGDDACSPANMHDRIMQWRGVE